MSYYAPVKKMKERIKNGQFLWIVMEGFLGDIKYQKEVQSKYLKYYLLFKKNTYIYLFFHKECRKYISKQ